VKKEDVSSLTKILQDNTELIEFYITQDQLMHLTKVCSVVRENFRENFDANVKEAVCLTLDAYNQHKGALEAKFNKLFEVIGEIDSAIQNRSKPSSGM
jgi:hypothetical protein